MKDDLPKYKKAEEQLNQLNYKGAEIGSLLSKYHTLGYLGSLNLHSNFRYVLSIIQLTLKGFFLTFPKAETGKILFLNKLSNRPQCNALIDPIAEEFKDTSILYAPDRTGRTNYNFSKRLTLKTLLHVINFLLKKFADIVNIYKENDLKLSRFELLFFLYLQLISYSNWFEYFNNSQIGLLVTDFDRDLRTSPIILAARKNNIKSITLVHGILNPPFAYVPIIADQIWCWGNFQKKQLISYGVAKDRIHVVGNPIAMEYMNINRKTYDEEVIRIGIGLNPIGMDENKHFLNTFRMHPFQKRIFWIVKLHPSMQKTEWMKEMEFNNFEFYENDELDNKSFFDEIDLLIVTNSGIGYEAVVNGIPIWVYRVIGGQNGHDGVMIELGHCPEINNSDILNKEIVALTEDKKNYLGSLLVREREFVIHEFYAAIGEDATQNIIRGLKTILSDGE